MKMRGFKGVFWGKFQTKQKNKTNNKMKLGDIVKDKISGFKGVFSSRTEYLNGCVHIGITPQKLAKDGTLARAEFFDEQQVEFVSKGSLAIEQKDTGGPSVYGRPKI